MKRVVLLLNLILATSFILADNIENYLGEAYFYIEGKINNYSDSQNDGIIQIVVQGYIDQDIVNIPIARDGHFHAKIPITDIQDVSFFLNNTHIEFFTFRDDTVKIEFEEDKPLQTLKLSGYSEKRNNELALNLSLSRFRHSNPRSSLINVMMDRAIPDSIKREKIDGYYTRQADLIKAFQTENGPIRFENKFINDAYYQTCEIALRGGTAYLPAINKGYSHAMSSYRLMDSGLFRTSAAYRHFLRYYIFMNGLARYEYAGEEDDGVEISTLKREYYYALSQLESAPIRDWYVVERFLSNYAGSTPEDIRYVIDDFKTICRNETYIVKMEKLYQDILDLYNAPSAPDFELKNEHGELVSLSDFRGKIVYLDFWDSHCGPCINEFKNYDKKFHQKYERYDIVHIYVCFSNDENRWKRDIREYDLQGINLTTPSRKNNTLYKDYSFYGFPHYILISKDGKIYKNGCESPSKMLSLDKNSLDMLLELED